MRIRGAAVAARLDDRREFFLATCHLRLDFVCLLTQVRTFPHPVLLCICGQRIVFGKRPSDGDVQ
jgi:hypothetical protein